jgi:hypothetical protein
MAMQSGPGGETEIMSAQGGGDPTVIYVREKAHWGRRILVFIGVVGLVAATAFALMAANLIPKLRNPFATETTDRSGPVLLQSIQDLSKYVGAQGNFQVLVDLQENRQYIPNFVFNERTLFVGVGAVDAYVDFGGIGEESVVISPDGKSVDIKLPAAQLEKPSLDVDKSYVFAQERGIVNAIGDLVGTDPNKEAQLYQLAEDKIAEAAESSELRTRAETNTRLMLESLVRGLGFERVTVTYTGT